MGSKKGGRQVGHFKWHWLVLGLVVISLALAAAGQVVALRIGEVQTPSVALWTGAAAAFGAAVIMTVFSVLLLMWENVRSIRDGLNKLEMMVGLLNQNRSAILQMSQVESLSDSARRVLLAESDTQALRKAVLDKLHQQDFGSTYGMISQIEQVPGFESLAAQLRAEADRYRGASEQERSVQVMNHIDRLCEDYQWAEANAEIDKLVRLYGESENTRAMRQKLMDAKQQRKKELLRAWDDAVKKRQTDHSLEILKELDLYLTPNEGLALQESARDVFRTKLHNLGVEFSLAVADRRWSDALQSGEQIMSDFPNSRMAQEIREKIEILREKATAAEQRT